jgi:hypothetical protein
MGLCGSIRSITEHVEVKHHGWVNFYTGTGDNQNGTYVWHEYWAKFTDGKLIEIVAENPTGGEW